MELTWAEHLSVGNALIDSDHKNLIVVINSVVHAIQTGDRIALSQTFKLFDAYMNIHFRNEKRIAETVKFPFAQIRFEHQQLMNEMRYMVDKLAAMHDPWPDSVVSMYSRFLNGWVTDHITKAGMQMKPTLQDYPYDLKPVCGVAGHF